MLKTNVNKVSNPGSFFIVYGVLKGYMSGSFRFLLTTALSFKKFKKSIKLDLPEEFLKSSGFMAWLYIRLCKKINKEDAFEITRACILTSGLAVQQANFRCVEDERTFDNLVKYQKKNNLEGTTKLNKQRVVDLTDSKYEFKIEKCMFYELFTYLKIPELTSIMCSIDNAIFNTYLPDELVFHRNGLKNTMYDGARECTFVIDKI